ncbi:MAG: hypothetical protein KF859_13615 [Phycisphaeraceae bacterium]|nr:hypothetical protein [Phycisphaeraceae bacterium]
MTQQNHRCLRRTGSAVSLAIVAAFLPALSVGVWAGGVIGVVVGCKQVVQPPQFRANVSAQAEVAGVTSFDIETSVGTILMEAADVQRVEIAAEIISTTQERADGAQVSAALDESTATLRVSVIWPGGQVQSGDKASITVRVPRGHALHRTAARSNVGRISLAGLGGQADITAKVGAIDIVRHAGPVKAQSDTGSITIDGASAVEATAGTGRVSATLSPDAPGPVNITIGTGAAEIGIGPGFTGTIDASTKLGGVKVASSRAVVAGVSSSSAGVWKFGEGEQTSMVRVSTGAITIIDAP